MTNYHYILGLSEKIRAERQARGWSQDELAEKTGFSRNYVGNVERGNTVPTLVFLLKAGEAFQLPVTYLMEEEERQRYMPVSGCSSYGAEDIVRELKRFDLKDEDYRKICRVAVLLAKIVIEER